MNTAIQTHDFGSTGRKVTRVGLGGEGVLRTYGKTGDAEAVIREAIARGINYFDSARVYSDSEVYYGGIWEQAPDTRAAVFQASKSASRDREGAKRDLEETLNRLKTDHLDLWQIHDVRTQADLTTISGPGGALEAFREARDNGRVRHIGVTGHHDPDILAQAVAEWPVDAVMLPVNPVEGLIGGFLTRTLPAAKAKGIAVIGMKILGAGNYVVPRLGVTADLLIRYALEQEISVAIVGCSTPEEVRTLAEAGISGAPLSDAERDELLAKFEPNAPKLAYYRGVV